MKPASKKNPPTKSSPKGGGGKGAGKGRGRGDGRPGKGGGEGDPKLTDNGPGK